MALTLVSAAREENIALDTEIIFNHPVFMDMSLYSAELRHDRVERSIVGKWEISLFICRNCAPFDVSYLRTELGRLILN